MIFCPGDSVVGGLLVKRLDECGSMHWLLRVMDVAAEISVVPGAELWKGIPLPEDCDAPQFVVGKEALIPSYEDCKGTYLSDNRILTNILEKVSQEGSYEKIQKFVVCLMKEGERRHIPASQHLFSGPSQLFDFMKSHPALVQKNSRVDISWIFLLFVVRTAHGMGLTSAAEDIPFSEVAWSLLNGLDIFLANTEQTESLRRDVKEILDSISAISRKLSEDLAGMSDRKEPLATFYRYLISNPHAGSLKDKMNELRRKFELFYRIANSNFDISLSIQKKQMLYYSISRSYRIIRTMVGCIVSARVDKRGDLATEFGQMLTRLGVDLLMYTLEYNLDYSHMESVVMDGIKNSQSKPAPWDSVDLGEMTLTPPECIHGSKRELLAALTGLGDALGLSLPELADERSESMSRCTDAAYFCLLIMISEDISHEELCDVAKVLEMAAKRERLMKVKDIVILAYLAVSGFALAFIILQYL